MFRDHIFVIAIDGSLIDDENLQNILLDLAVLRSLNIKVVLVHGIGKQIQTLSKSRQQPISDPHGEAVTDSATLDLAIEASAMVSQRIMQGLTQNNLRCVGSNAVRSKLSGIHKGIDYQNTGTVDKIDSALIERLIEVDTIPVVSPIVFDREGKPLRVNSDALAAELALELKASKLIFLHSESDLNIGGLSAMGLPVEELRAIIEAEPSAIPERLRSKVLESARAVEAGLPRAHILNGRVFGALLNEIFDKVGVGIMIYSTGYQSIRRASHHDAATIYEVISSGIRNEALRPRTLEEIEAEIEDYLLYEIDGSIVSCVSLRSFAGGEIIELGSVYVDRYYQNKGVGRKMITFACEEAQKRGASRIIAMTTQAAGFFANVCGFSVGSVDNLPEDRRATYLKSGRNSKILFLDL